MLIMRPETLFMMRNYGIEQMASKMFIFDHNNTTMKLLKAFLPEIFAKVLR